MIKTCEKDGRKIFLHYIMQNLPKLESDAKGSSALKLKFMEKEETKAALTEII